MFLPRRLLRWPAIRVLIGSILIWVVIFEYCRYHLWRDPHSAYFNDEHVYDLRYSLYREREARHFIGRYNTPTDAPNATVGDGHNPAICAVFVTVKRGLDDYFEPSLGSLFEGLDVRERQALRLNVLFADTDPTRHPSWGERWVGRLVDSAGSYNVSEEKLQRVKDAERDRNFYVKGVL